MFADKEPSRDEERASNSPSNEESYLNGMSLSEMRQVATEFRERLNRPPVSQASTKRLALWLRESPSFTRLRQRVQEREQGLQESGASATQLLVEEFYATEFQASDSVQKLVEEFSQFHERYERVREEATLRLPPPGMADPWRGAVGTRERQLEAERDTKIARISEDVSRFVLNIPTYSENLIRSTDGTLTIATYIPSLGLLYTAEEVARYGREGGKSYVNSCHRMESAIQTELHTWKRVHAILKEVILNELERPERGQASSSSS